jgi:GNAT superfamily N-acetyltransferase
MARNLGKRTMPTIRPFQADDLDDLYGISLATGLAGGDASQLYADPRLMGHIYSAPYARLEPALALVVVDGQGVAGFAVGTADTTGFEAKLERMWWPALRTQYLMPPDADPRGWTPDQRRIFMIHRPALTPVAVAVKFPAHLHVNILPRLHGRGVGRQLVDRWLSAASRLGARAAHVAINRDNAGALRFWERMGFADLPRDGWSEGRTIWKGRSE